MKIFATMITPGIGGAGDYLELIIKNYDGYVKIHPINFRVRNIYFRKILSEIQIVILKILFLFLKNLKIEELVIYHPQTIGYNISNKLIVSSHKIIYYVLDASIFCIKSYNHRNLKECEKCILKIDPYKDCSFFPRNNSQTDFNYHNELLRKKLECVTFITQTKGYNEILKKMFGSNVIFSVEKMRFDKLKTLNPKSIKSKKYDFVFHGNNLPAKGSDYVLSLAKKMPSRVFLMPFKGNNRGNLFFKNINWNSGLQEAISSSRIVLCPSFWSAPLEASILKTMLLKTPVALYSNQHSASKTLIPVKCFINLCGDINKDVVLLNKIIKDESLLNTIKQNAYDWAKNYINE